MLSVNSIYGAAQFVSKIATSDRILPCALLIFSNLSWILAVPFCPQLTGVVALCWVSRGASLLLMAYITENARLGKILQDYKPVVEEHRKSLADTKEQISHLTPTLAALKRDLEHTKGENAEIEQRNKELKAAATSLSLSAEQIGVAVERLPSLVEDIKTANAEEATLNRESARLNEERNAITERLEMAVTKNNKQLQLIKLALSIAMKGPKANINFLKAYAVATAALNLRNI